ncbi:hypothetical protein [Streptomyces sp. NBC_00996]|uniref:hypothetical protein n=1 Tax=Streptomyces sp. NBC_00996 TaxID=2903710 RepID=UPI00386C999F|nr:alpha/beta hydrolase [Streptomyces sp. NBC_00996]
MAGLGTDPADAKVRASAPLCVDGVPPGGAAGQGSSTPDSYEYFTHTRTELDPEWANKVTLRSLDNFYGYEPTKYLPDVTPTPILVIVGREDGLTGGNLAASAYETAAEPKKIVLLPGGHFAAYTGDWFTVATQVARDWFGEHLSAA